MMNFTSPQSTLQTVDHHFKIEAGKSVNRLMTICNWLFGFYIVEFQQHGEDRAKYGEELLKKLAKAMNQKSFSYRSLRLYRQFYLTYPTFGKPIYQILQKSSIWQTLSAKFSPPPEKIISHLSFSHLTLLLAIDEPLKRAFYEIESIKGGWGVRELKRQINTMLFERTGFSKDKEELLRRVHEKAEPPTPSDYFRSPYIFEFLELPEQALYKESNWNKRSLTTCKISSSNSATAFALRPGKKGY